MNYGDWYKIEWAKRQEAERKKTELLFGATDQLRTLLSVYTSIDEADLVFHSITKYTIHEEGNC